MSTFGGVETLLSSLRVQSLAQQIASHNLANANTSGYSRQLAVLSSSSVPVSVPAIHSVFGAPGIGTGVYLSSIARIRDEFLDFQIRHELSNQGRRRAMLEAVNAMAVLFPEIAATPGTGLITALRTFFTEFAAVAAAPTDAAARTAAVQAAQTLASFFNGASRTLIQLQNTTDARVRDSMVRINALLTQIAEANAGISQALASGGTANDLMDKRDLALAELSSLIKIDTVKLADGSVLVLTGNGRTLVRGDDASQLVAVASPHEPRFANVGFKDYATGTITDITDEIGGGAIRGQLDARDQVLAGQLLEINQLASSLIEQANKLHRAGYALDGTTTNLPLFVGTEARDIAVNSAIVAAPSLLAASRLYGDGTNGEQAESIALLESMIMNMTVESLAGINVGPGQFIDPTLALNDATTSALNVAGSNSVNFAVLPAAAGTIVINGVSINWTNADSIEDIIGYINNPALGLGVRASFDYTTQKLTIISEGPVSISDAAGNLAAVLGLEVMVSSLAPMNNGIGPLDRPIDPLAALDASLLEYFTPSSTQGTITINGVSINWDASQTLSTILANINAAIAPLGLIASFSVARQEFLISGLPAVAAVTPVTIVDTEGNLSMAFNAEAQPVFGQFADAVLAQVQAQTDGARSLADQADAAVAQLNLQRDAISKVNVDEEEARILQYLRAYQAAVRAIASLDEMLNTLINRMAVSSSSSTGTVFSA